MNTGGFNKSRCIENIYFMAKQQNVRIGDLESTAGVSSGYLSRLNKEGNSSNPGIECIANMARQLRIPLDILLYADLAPLTSTEQYLVDFLKKLLKDTNSDTLVWKMETPDDIEKNCQDHLLFDSEIIWHSEVSTEEVYNYVPIVPVSDKTDILHNGYHATLNGNNQIYLMSITTGHDDEDFDLYLYPWGHHREPVCSTRNSKSELVELMKLLYSAISAYMQRLHIAPEVKGVIDTYIHDGDEPTANIDDEDIPF